MIKFAPYVIVMIHSSMMLFKRRFLITFDDVICFIIFFTSISLYFTYESPTAVLNGRSTISFNTTSKYSER